MDCQTDQSQPQYDPRVIRRAAVIWRRLLETPEYRATNENSGPEDIRNMGMAAFLARSIPTNSTPGLLDQFSDELQRRIEAHIESEGFAPYMHVDYGPDEILAESAKAVGLEIQFPWKTNVRLRRDAVSVSAGYVAEYIYHYPLNDGRWLVSSLSGSDVAKLIELIESGFDLGLTIEVDEPQPV